MSLKTHFELMARYNAWMNEKLYRAAAQLPDAALREDRKAFFGSVFGTLGHVMTGDTIWLKRFADHPAAFRALEPVRPLPHPNALTDVPYADFGALRQARVALDQVIVAFVDEIQERDLAVSLTYANRAGHRFTDPFGPLLQHFFNHQTHHRGQATTLLSQAGIDVGVTDLVALIRDRDA